MTKKLDRQVSIVLTLEWLAANGGRARYIPCRRSDAEADINLEDENLLISPMGEICLIRPRTFELMDEKWFTLYQDEADVDWACIAIHPGAYDLLLADAKSQIKKPAPAVA